MPRTTTPKPHPASPAAWLIAAWRPVAAEMPDSDSTVLIHHPDEDDPVWFGYHDGQHWRTVEGARCCVSHWSPLPDPPVNDEVYDSAPLSGAFDPKPLKEKP